LDHYEIKLNFYRNF